MDQERGFLLQDGPSLFLIVAWDIVDADETLAQQLFQLLVLLVQHDEALGHVLVPQCVRQGNLDRALYGRTAIGHAP